MANLSINYTWKNVRSAYDNNKSKVSAPTWNDEFDFPDGSYSISMLKTTNEEFQSIEVWLTDQNNRPLERETNVNITLIIGTG